MRTIGVHILGGHIVRLVRDTYLIRDGSWKI